VLTQEGEQASKGMMLNFSTPQILKLDKKECNKKMVEDFPEELKQQHVCGTRT
jgi:hypothetical protein